MIENDDDAERAIADTLRLDPNDINELDPEALEGMRDTTHEIVAYLDNWLADMRADVEEDRIRLRTRQQIADPAALAAANTEIRDKSMQRNQLQHLEGRISRRLRSLELARADTDTQRFVDSARAMLPRDTFEAIWRNVRR